MRLALFVVLTALAALAACKTANPNVCCATEAQCADLGVDDLRPCKAGQACNADFTCIASECDDSSDCSSDAPVCINNLCVASCVVDADCAGSPGGDLCADDGVCVGCKSSADCSGDTPFCDAEDRACRGCERDSECTGGVCLEADAVCVADADVTFLSQNGTDAGSCGRSTPCRTLRYALTQPHLVAHFDGGSTDVGAAALSFERSLYIDGTNTKIEGGSASGVLEISEAGSNDRRVTLNSVTIGPGSGNAVTSSLRSANIRVHNSIIERPIDVSNGTFQASRSRITRSIKCTSGSLKLDDNQIQEASVEAMACQVTAARNQFESRSGVPFTTQGGLVTFENNLVVVTDRYVDALYVTSSLSGSSVRFNTIVSQTGVTTSDPALYCDETLDVSNNIIAYNSTNPISQNCRPRFTLFDSITPPSDTMGEGNKVGDVGTFFADRDRGDFHLSNQSPAKDVATPGTGVLTDLDGNPRGPMPDMGAFEAP